MITFQFNPAQKHYAQLFLELPFRLYANDPAWVPPLAMDARLMLDQKHHPFYKHSAAGFFLCMHQGRVIGRLAALDNRPYNDHNHTQTAFFHLFECEDNLHAALSLFDQAGKWAASRGLTELTGPKGFTLLDGMGMLVKGFNLRPALGIPYNPEYYPRLLEEIGFTTRAEIVSGYLDPGADLPSRLHEVSSKLQERRGLYIAHFRTRWDLRKLISHLKDLYNGALEGTSGTYPLTDADISAMASQLIAFADLKLIKVVMKKAQTPLEKDRPVGFLLAYPDVSAAFQSTRGKLFPLGWLRILRERGRTEWVNINGAGMLNEYRGLGGTAILFSEMHKTISASGQFKHAEIVQIGVENDRMQRELRDLGVDFYKMHRIYGKRMDGSINLPETGQG